MPSRTRLSIAAAVVATVLGFAAGSAQADTDTCTGRAVQEHGPLVVAQSNCVLHDTDGWVSMNAKGRVKRGNADVLACAVFARMWTNGSLVMNVRGRLTKDCRRHNLASPQVKPRKYGSGSVITVQTWFDVRYRDADDRIKTHRFEAPQDTYTIP